MIEAIFLASAITAVRPNSSTDFYTAISCAADSTGRASSKNCLLTLTNDGFVKDTNSGKKFFDEPVDNSTMQSTALYRIGKNYLLTTDSYSSSKNSQWLIMSYDGRLVTASQLISVERDIQPHSAKWVGWECRTSEPKPLTAASPPLASAASALCGTDMKEINNNATPHDFSEKDAFVKKLNGLRLTMNVYGDPTYHSSSYLFYGSDVPDFTRMLCFSNCATGKNETRFIGDIGSGNWIDMTLTGQADSLSGVYYYLKYRNPIFVSGSLNEEGMMLLNEYGSKKDISDAVFTGSGTPDALKGLWKSSTGKTFPFILLRSGF